MTKAEEYKERIKAMDWPELKDLWTQIKTKSTSDWPPGKALEYFVVRAFELSGFQVRYPFEVMLSELQPGGSSSIAEQIDGAISKDGLHILIESKDEKRTNVSTAYKLHSQLQRRPPAMLGCLVFTGAITYEALSLINFIMPRRLLLLNPREIQEEITKDKPDFHKVIVEKFVNLCETGIVRYPNELGAIPIPISIADKADKSNKRSDES